MGCPEEMFKPFSSCRVIHTLVQVVGRVLGVWWGERPTRSPQHPKQALAGRDLCLPSCLR